MPPPRGHAAQRIDAAIAEPHRAAEVVEQLGLVGHHQYGHAAIGVHGGEELHDLVGRAGVQVAGGLVGQEHIRLVDQRPGDRDTLLLTAGELIGAVVGAIGESDRLQGRQGAGSALAG